MARHQLEEELRHNDITLSTHSQHEPHPPSSLRSYPAPTNWFLLPLSTSK